LVNFWWRNPADGFGTDEDSLKGFLNKREPPKPHKPEDGFWNLYPK
jgi:hypothetical protein